MAEKEKAMIKEPEAMEIETEADRELLCEKIVAKLKQASVAHTAVQQSQGSAAAAANQRDGQASSAQGNQAKSGAPKQAN
jgi:hypothetical protein